jgi:electron transfer flavoprotein alpha subunit
MWRQRRQPSGAEALRAAGFERAGMVVAINRDPNAPIFRVADHGFAGGLFDIVPALTGRIAEAKARR